MFLRSSLIFALAFIPAAQAHWVSIGALSGRFELSPEMAQKYEARAFIHLTHGFTGKPLFVSRRRYNEATNQTIIPVTVNADGTFATPATRSYGSVLPRELQSTTVNGYFAVILANKENPAESMVAQLPVHDLVLGNEGALFWNFPSKDLGRIQIAGAESGYYNEANTWVSTVVPVLRTPDVRRTSLLEFRFTRVSDVVEDRVCTAALGGNLTRTLTGDAAKQLLNYPKRRP